VGRRALQLLHLAEHGDIAEIQGSRISSSARFMCKPLIGPIV
jgi:hypothetical protein